MTELTSSKGYPNTENDFHTRASPRKSSRNGDGMFLDPLITKSPHKRGRDTDASSRNGQSKGVSRKSDCKYYYRKVFKQLVDTINKSLKSPPRSPSSKAKFNLDENMVELELEPDTDFEQSLRYFEYSRETVKAYWFIPLKEILNSENNEVRLESLPFPANHNKKWRFMAEISKNQAKLTKVYFGIESILNEDEEKNLEWKREPYVFIRITLKKNNFDIEKGFNRTFSNKCKDSGIIQQEKGLADIDLNANDYFIIESLIRENKVTKNNTSEYVGLINAGNTCYMNSFLQTLYHLPAFARSVYKVPFTSDKPESIPTALQKLFYNLKYSRKPVTTTELIKSFGWDKKQAWIQQDVQEFCCLLLAALENKTKGIAEVEGTINDLFEGKVSSIIKCIDVDFTSVREEKFLEIQLMVKGMRNIYQSLDYFVQEEELKGDNKYDAESYGKQDATKHILFEKLPPVLLILLKRFEYDYQTDTNVKINDSCEYYDEIDMGKYMMPEHNQETKYRLFSVLVHSGSGTSSGHYYVFIRPGGPSNSKLDDCFTKMIDGKWFKLNDELVGFAEPGDVFEANFGGTHTEAKLNEKKEIQTWEATNESNAYMIVYIREDQIKTLLKPIADIDVPRRLIEDIEKNKKIEEERRKKGEDFFKVYLTSFELLTDLDHPGLTFYKMGSKDDDCYNRFLQNKRKRIKVYLKKNFKVYDLLKFVSENSGIPQDQIMIWKISLAKEQISQVLKRGYLTSSPNVSVLANGVNSNQTKSIFFVHTLDRKRYPRIFNVREKYVSSFFDINCKNMLEFVNYNNSPIEIEDRSDKIEVEAPEKDSSKVEELLKTQNQLFLDLLDEKYLLVFLKNYTCRNGEPRIELRDFFLINKTLFVHDLLEVIQHRDENFEKENIIFYREDKKKYLLEPLQLKDALDDESADQGLVCVMEHKGLDFQGINYKTAQEHYQQLSNRVWVTFVPNDVRENAMKTLQDGNMPYAGIIEYVSKNLFNGEVDPERILLKAKFKNAFAFNPVPYDEDGSVKLVDLLKHDDKVFCEVSKIEVNQLHKKLKCLVSYYSVITNNCTNEEEVFVEKNSTVQKLLEDIQNFALFADERNNDRETLNRSAQLRLILVDKKKNKLIGQAQNDQSLGPYVQKYRLRVELVPDEYDSESVKDPNEKFYPVLCVHATKDGEYFSNPFLFFSKKTVSGNTLRENLYDYIKDWEVYCDKKIIITKDYFNKIKFILKSEISESKYTKLEPEENYPFQELDPEAKKYTLELIHPFNMPNNHAQMKIST